VAQPQPQQTQQTKPEPTKPRDPLDGFTPNESTMWLAQHLMGLEAAITLALQDRYDTVPGRVVSQIDVRRLSERHTIVPVFVDLREPVRDEKTGKLRKRKLRGDDKDPVELKFGKPISCSDLVVSDDESGFTNVQMTNLKDEDGRIRKGLLGILEESCRRINERGKPAALVHGRYRSDDSLLTLTDL
jgi:hypothetical protein